MRKRVQQAVDHIVAKPAAGGGVCGASLVYKGLSSRPEANQCCSSARWDPNEVLEEGRGHILTLGGSASWSTTTSTSTTVTMRVV